jgi:iron complex outermembrane recepter protein
MRDLGLNKRSLLLSTTIAGALCFVLPAAAQTTAPSSDAAVDRATDDGSDIIVTANRREERAQRVGVSLTAISGDLLTDRNILTSEDLGRLVPGLNATAASGSGVSLFVIRGVGQTDFSDHQEQPNASYQDGVYVPFGTATGIPLFDLQRVEALRGPQGTLFGRNATGGLIQYISNRPVAGTSSAFEGAFGSRDLRRLQGYFNAGNDVIAGRLALYYQSQDGFIKNTLGRARGNKDVYALRGQIRITPSDNTTIILRADGFNQSGTPSGYKATPEIVDFANGNSDLPANVDYYGTGPGNDPNGYRNPFSGLTVALNEPGFLTKRSRNYAMTIEQNLGAATLTSTTAYATVFNNYFEDTDSTPLDTFTAESVSSARDFQQELRINGSAGNLRYTAGLFYLDIDGTYSLNNKIVISSSLGALYGLPAGTVFEQNQYSLHTKSQAVYGQGEYDLTDKLTFILGARYTWDQFRFNLATTCQETAVGVCNFFGGPSGIGPLNLRAKEGDWSGKAQLNFKPADNILLYASASKGVKSGGFSAVLTNALPAEPLNFKPENLYAYEIGAKNQFFDRKLTVNASAYYYDYKNYQTFLFATVATLVLNRDAKAYGGELEITARPFNNFSGNLSVAYNHFDVKAVAAGLGDQRPINAPRLQVNWGLNKTFDLSDDLEFSFGYAGRHISSAFYNIINSPLTRAPAYTVNDFNLRLESKRGWYVAGYLTNAFDKQYQVGAFDTFLGYTLRQYGETRTFSAAVGFKL